MDHLDTACRALPGHKLFKHDRKVMPVVLSAKRFDGIQRRSKMMRKSSIYWTKDMAKDVAAAKDVGAQDVEVKYEEAKEVEAEYDVNEDEENNYEEAEDGEDESESGLSLQEGNRFIDNYFANNRVSTTLEKRMRNDQEKLEDEIRRKQIKIHDERTRKERIIRATRILQELKPGHVALHRARLLSEMTYQRKFNEALNREIAEAAKQDDGLCPEVFIPYRSTTEEEEKAMEDQKRKELHDYYVQELKARHEQRLAQKEQDETEIIIERAQYQCLHELEQKGVKAKKKASQEFCKQAFQDALKQKTMRDEYENKCELLDDRKLCVVNVMNRNLNQRVAAILKKKREDVIQQRAANATRLGNQLMKNGRKLEEQDQKDEQEYELKQHIDEERRKCLQQERGKERMAYERKHLQRLEKERKDKAEIQRFEVATRLKNMETNARFKVKAKRMQQVEKENLKQMLTKQRNEFLQRRDAETVHKLTCVHDVHLHDDLAFFEEGVNVMLQAREAGRPVYPIAQAVQEYRKTNEIDFVPEGKGVKRNKLRDYCWPGYHAKADVPYLLYEKRDECRRRNDLKLHTMLENSIKITQMAAEEKQQKPSVTKGLIKCLQHRGVPTIKSVESFDYNFNVPNNSFALNYGQGGSTPT